MQKIIKEYQILVNDSSVKRYDDFELAKKVWSNIEGFIQSRGGNAKFKIRDTVFNQFNKLVKVETKVYCEIES